jgi:hypothetical protein
MEPRLTRGEYWLLNDVVDTTTPLCMLVSTCIEELFNNPGHRLSRPRLIETLVEMSDRGWIEGYRFEDGFPLTAQLVEAGFGETVTAEGGELGYRLTKLGGEVWEAFAAPDWDRYINAWTSSEGEVNEYFCATKWRLEKYLSLVHLLEIEVLPESVVWDEVRPWQATYWKLLPHGHRVQFVHRDIRHPEEYLPPPFPTEVTSLRRWYDWE